MDRTEIDWLLDSAFSSSVNVLGTSYSIEILYPDKDEGLRRPKSTPYGYTAIHSKRIVIADHLGDEESEDTVYNGIEWMKKTLRHEIVHAFLAESGLMNNTKFSGAWSGNEEMVDWIAMQGRKIYKAWMEAGAV